MKKQKKSIPIIEVPSTSLKILLSSPEIKKGKVLNHNEPKIKVKTFHS